MIELIQDRTTEGWKAREIVGLCQEYDLRRRGTLYVLLYERGAMITVDGGCRGGTKWKGNPLIGARARAR